MNQVLLVIATAIARRHSLSGKIAATTIEETAQVFVLSVQTILNSRRVLRRKDPHLLPPLRGLGAWNGAGLEGRTKEAERTIAWGFEQGKTAPPQAPRECR